MSSERDKAKYLQAKINKKPNY